MRDQRHYPSGRGRFFGGRRILITLGAVAIVASSFTPKALGRASTPSTVRVEVVDNCEPKPKHRLPYFFFGRVVMECAGLRVIDQGDADAVLRIKAKANLLGGKYTMGNSQIGIHRYTGYRLSGSVEWRPKGGRVVQRSFKALERPPDRIVIGPRSRKEDELLDEAFEARGSFPDALVSLMRDAFGLGPLVCIICHQGSASRLRDPARQELFESGAEAVDLLLASLPPAGGRESRSRIAGALDSLSPGWRGRPEGRAAIARTLDVELNQARERSEFACRRMVALLPDALLTVGVAQALGELGDRCAIGPLQEALKHADAPEEQRVISEAIERIEEATLLAGCAAVARGFFTEALNAAKSRGLQIDRGKECFSVRLRPQVHGRRDEILEGCPAFDSQPDPVFRVYLQDGAFTPDKLKALREAISRIAGFSGGREYALEIPIRQSTVGVARNALDQVFLWEEGLRQAR